MKGQIARSLPTDGTAVAATTGMPEPEEKDEHVERKVVYETVSSSSTKANAVTFIVIIVVAIALIAWIVMHMR